MMRTKGWTKPHVVAAGAVNGNTRAGSSQPYTYGATSSTRPGPKDTYVLVDADGAAVEHTFDGKCHRDCENLR